MSARSAVLLKFNLQNYRSLKTNNSVSMVKTHHTTPSYSRV